MIKGLLIWDRGFLSIAPSTVPAGNQSEPDYQAANPESIGEPRYVSPFNVAPNNARLAETNVPNGANCKPLRRL